MNYYYELLCTVLVVVVVVVVVVGRISALDEAYCYRWYSVVSRSVTNVSPAKTAEPIEMSFWTWTQLGPRNHALDEVQIHTREGAILATKRGLPRTCRNMSGGGYTQSDSAGGGDNRYGVDADWVVPGCTLATPGEYD